MRRIALLLPFTLLACATSAAAHGIRTDSSSAAQLRADMRKLWEDHVGYTAFFYKAAIDGGDDAGKIAARLLRNQDDIGNAVKAFYGEDAGNKVAALLRDHILIAADLVKAVRCVLPETVRHEDFEAVTLEPNAAREQGDMLTILVPAKEEAHLVEVWKEAFLVLG